MAEVLGVFSTVAGLVALAASVSKQVYSFMGDVKDAPKGINTLSDEVEGMSTVLRRLESSMRDDFSSKYPLSQGAANDLLPVLGNCERIFRRIERKLEALRGERFLDRIQFVFAEKDIAKLQRSLEAQKQTLTITLMLLVNYSTKETHQTASETKDIAEETKITTSEIKGLVFELMKDIKTKQDSPSGRLEPDTSGVITQYLKRTKTLILPDSTPDEAETSEICHTAAEASEKSADSEMESLISGDPQEDNKTRPTGTSATVGEQISASKVGKAAEPQKPKEVSDPISEKTADTISNRPEDADRLSEVMHYVTVDSTRVATDRKGGDTAEKPPADLAPKKVISKAMAEKTMKALSNAATSGNMKMTMLLLDLVTDLETVHDKYVGIVLQAATARGQNEIVRVLLERGANVNVPRNIYILPPLTIAMAENNDELTKLFLDRGACANTLAGMWEGTMLNFALIKGDDNLAQRLLAMGADPNLQGHINAFYPLQTALAARNVAAIHSLMEKGANLNNHNVCSGTPLIMAIRADDNEMVRLLLDKGADVNCWGEAYAGTPLNVALKLGRNDLARYLLSRGADPNSQGDTNALFPLQTAVENNNREAVNFLLENGADANLHKTGTKSVLDMAVDSQDEELMMFFLSR